MLGRIAAAAALGLCLTTATFADKDEEAVLTIGDQAPKLDVDHWIKMAEWLGDKPLTEYEPGKVYVLEFWATWCGPCRAGMPHISEVQERFKDYDVTIVGVSSEPLPVVFNFLTKADKEGVLWNDKTRYTLASDPDRSVSNSYMKPADQYYIPTAFIIGKDGRIEWIGSPREMDEPLDAVVRDKWDRAAFKTEFEPKRKADREKMRKQRKLQAAMEKEQWSKVYEMVKDDPGTLNRIAWTIATDDTVKNRDLGVAMKAAKRAAELTDTKEPAILDTLARVCYEQGDLESAVKWQRKAVEHAGDDPMGDDIRATLKQYEKEMRK